MFLTRKIGSILRGKATPPQVMVATILAGMLGFVPGFFLMRDLGGGFMQAPALILGLLFLVLLLNANLAVFGITLLIAKLLSYVLLPVSFAIGRFLLDGPTEGLFRALINAPLLAWCGLEHYATTGGLTLGLVFGLAVGIGLLRTLRVVRLRMADVEEHSERYQKWSNKRSVRVLTWAFLGKGKGKRSWRELAESDKKGLPVRITGLVVVLVVGAGLWLGHSFLTGAGMRNAVQGGLENWNGATVDLAQVKVDLPNSSVELTGLAIADRNQPTQDSFRADRLALKISTVGLLSKRLVIDELTSAEASSGTARQTPGQVIAAPQPPPPPPPGEGKTLEDYLKQAKVWKERLQQISRWLEKISGGSESAPQETKEQRRQRIEEEARELGMVRVTAGHLITGSPLVLVKKLNLQGLKVSALGTDLLDIEASNLSSNPGLVPEPLQVSVRARSGVFAFTFAVPSGQSRAATTSFTWKGLKVDDIAGELAVAPMRGGTIDLAISGNLDCTRPEGVWIELPLQVHLHDTTLQLPGLQPTQVKDFVLPLGLRGPLSSPRVSIDDKALTDALVAAGKQELANQVQKRTEDLLKGKVPEGVIDPSKSPDQVIDAASKKAEEEAKKQAEGALKKGLGDLFGGKKDGKDKKE